MYYLDMKDYITFLFFLLDEFAYWICKVFDIKHPVAGASCPLAYLDTLAYL
jgi:hypothetical protein